MQTHNAIIKKADLQIHDSGILTTWINLEYNGIVGYFGGIPLYLPHWFKYHDAKSLAGHFIYRVMQVADAKDWGELVGKPIRARVAENQRDVLKIGHITKDDWLCIKTEVLK